MRIALYKFHISSKSFCGSKDFSFIIEGTRGRLQTGSSQNGREERYARPFRKYLSDGYKKKRGTQDILYCVSLVFQLQVKDKNMADLILQELVISEQKLQRISI